MKYKEIMGKIEVTPEMHQRILHNIETMQEQKKKGLTRHLFTLAACVAIIVCCWFAWKPKPSQEQGVMVTNQIETVERLDRLIEKTGIPMEELTGLPFAVTRTEYTSYWGELAEILYSGETEALRYRKSLGTEDNSGDYNQYAQETTLPLFGCVMTLKGSADGYTLAVWTDGSYAYSISVSMPLSLEAFQTLLEHNFAS